MKKLLLGLGGMMSIATPVVVAISCGGNDSGTNGNVFDLTNITENEAHRYFRGNGDVKEGSVLKLTIDGQEYSATWTGGDVTSDSKASTPQDLFDIVIERFIEDNPSLNRDEIVIALGSTVMTSDNHNQAIA